MQAQTKVVIPYQPKDKQSKFHLSDKKYRLYIGAWRAGKSFAGCMEALKQSMLFKGNIGLIGRKDFSDLRDTTLKTFLDICPPEIIKSYNKTEHHVIFKNDSEIYFRDLKERASLGSLELGWFYIDEAEEVGEDVYLYLKGRLSSPKTKRQCGWLTSNPPNEDHWLYRHFQLKETPDSELIHASTYENRSNLPEGYIEGLETMPESWRKKYLMGEWGFTPDGKPFHQGFIESIHKKQLEYLTAKPIYRAWDYGFHHPAVSFHQIDAKGRWCVLAELMGTDVTIEKFGNQVKVFSRDRFPNAKFSDIDYGDPAGEQKSDKSEKTSVEILATMGIFVYSKPSTYRERQEIISRKLNRIEDGIVVDASCKTIIDGFNGGYHYPEKKAGQQFSPHLMEVPFRDGYYEHLMNTVEYFAVNMFQGAESAEDKTQTSYRIVGDMQDVRLEDFDEEKYSSAYAAARS